MATHKMKRHTKIALGTLGAIAVLGALASHHFGAGPERRSEHLVHYVERKIDLDTEQSQALQELRTLIIELRRDAGTGRDTQLAAALDLMVAPTLDRQGAMDLVASRTALLEEHADEVIAALANFMDRLTPSQKQQMRELIEAKMHRWQRWHR